MSDPHDHDPRDVAPGDDETLLPDSGPLTPTSDPVDDDESTVGGPP